VITLYSWVHVTVPILLAVALLILAFGLRDEAGVMGRSPAGAVASQPIFYASYDLDPLRSLLALFGRACSARELLSPPRAQQTGATGSLLSLPPTAKEITMTEPNDSRVGLYIDFDNIVISRYQQLHGRNAFQRDGIRDFDRSSQDADPEIAARLAAATVDFNAIIDFAASFGALVVNRAYADWSVPVNASYQRQLMSRAVDLTQLFTATTRGTKNGADIRLAVDVVEDLFRLPDLTHVIIVAGDSTTSPSPRNRNDSVVTSSASVSPGRRAPHSRRPAMNSRITTRSPESRRSPQRRPPHCREAQGRQEGARTRRCATQSGHW
jgi:hypothetical protein